MGLAFSYMNSRLVAFLFHDNYVIHPGLPYWTCQPYGEHCGIDKTPPLELLLVVLQDVCMYVSLLPQDWE